MASSHPFYIPLKIPRSRQKRQVSRLTTPYMQIFHRIPAPFLLIFTMEKGKALLRLRGQRSKAAFLRSHFPFQLLLFTQRSTFSSFNFFYCIIAAPKKSNKENSEAKKVKTFCFKRLEKNTKKRYNDISGSFWPFRAQRNTDSHQR